MNLRPNYCAYEPSILALFDFFAPKIKSELFYYAKTIGMKHAYSMLNFIVNDIVYSNMEEIRVTIGDIDYSPYKIKDAPVEFLVIIPLSTINIKNPVIRITTKQNQVHMREVGLIGATNGRNRIKDYKENTCYYFSLHGQDFHLSPITVTDWTTRQISTGDYIATPSTCNIE